MTKTNGKLETWLLALDARLTSSSRWLYLLFGVGLALKVIYVIQSNDSIQFRVPILDSKYYHNLALDIRAGHLLQNDAFFMGPLYPYVLASIYTVFGPTVLVARLIQVAAGAVTIILAYLLGREVFRPSVAFAGALMLLLYGATTFYESQILMMWLGTLLNMAMLLHLHRTRRSSGYAKYIITGVLLGLSALARANILIFAPVVLLWLLFVSGERRRLVKSAVLVATIVVTVAPATIHNYIVARDFVPITFNGGVNFYIGNHAEATGIFRPPEGVDFVTDQRIRNHVERMLGRDMKASEMSRYWYGRSLDFIKENPGEELRILLKKTALFFSGYEVPQIESFDHARREYGVLRLLFVRLWWIMALGLMGLVYSFKDWRKYFLLEGYVLSYSLSIIIFFVSARYRIQIAPVLCLFAAYALLVVLPGAIANIRRTLVPVVVLGAISFATWPGLMALSATEVEWREQIHQARRYSQAGEYDKAIEAMANVVSIYPDNSDSYLHRAIIEKENGKLFQAIDDYAKAIEINPELPNLHYDLAQTLRQVQMYEYAIREYKVAIELDPVMIEAYNNLGIAYRDTGDLESAITYFKKVVEMDPRYTKAYSNLGAAYAESGDLDDAIATFKRAIEVDPSYTNSYKNLAFAYIQSKNALEAYRHLDHYLSLEPDDRQAQDIMAQLRLAVEPDSLR